MSIADKLTTIAENEQKIYDKGRSDNESEFWNQFTNKGSRTIYEYAFTRWNDEYIRPPQKIAPTGSAHHIFLGCPKLKKIEKDYFDFSKVTGNYISSSTGIGVFCNGCSSLEEIEDVNFPNWGYYQAFANCPKLHTIARIPVCETTAYFTDWFTNCRSLQNITIDGTLARSVSFQYSPLSVASMKSVINALKDYSGTDSEFAYSLTLSGDCKTTLEAEGATSPNGNTWIDYINDKCWNLQ